jgi:ADP-ribose pyrophosphatase YjhB (NUDIX family)
MTERRRRIGAYGVCRDAGGRVLLVRASPRSVRPGTWFLPGGGVDHGEHPADAVVREVAEETGLAVTVTGVRDVVAEVVARPPLREHTDGVIYDVAVVGGVLRPEVDGTSDGARWVPPDEVAALPLSGLAAYALGVRAVPGPDPGPAGPAAAPGRRPRPARGQRFGAYGLVTGPDERLLLTLISDGYPSAGRWHLPGGGTDFGEQPAHGLLREITEESGQSGRIIGLLAVTNHHNRVAVGPDGHPVDWHSVRVVFQVTVPEPTPPRVLDAGGSTVEAAWFTSAETRTLALTDLARAVLGGGCRQDQP